MSELAVREIVEVAGRAGEHEPGRHREGFPTPLLAQPMYEASQIRTVRVGVLEPPDVSLPIERGELVAVRYVDVLVVLPADLREEDEDEYRERVAAWCAYASRVAGLPVAPLVLQAPDADTIRAKLIAEIFRDAIVIVGANPRDVLHAA